MGAEVGVGKQMRQGSSATIKNGWQHSLGSDSQMCNGSLETQSTSHFNKHLGNSQY